jgi:hypothetical protein
VDTPDLLLVLGQAYLLLVVGKAAVHYRPLARPLCQSRFVSVRILLLELVPPLLPLQQRRGDGGHCGGGVGSVRAAVAAQ